MDNLFVVFDHFRIVQWQWGTQPRQIMIFVQELSQLRRYGFCVEWKPRWRIRDGQFTKWNWNKKWLKLPFKSLILCFLKKNLKKTNHRWYRNRTCPWYSQFAVSNLFTLKQIFIDFISILIHIFCKIFQLSIIFINLKKGISTWHSTTCPFGIHTADKSDKSAKMVAFALLLVPRIKDLCRR